MKKSFMVIFLISLLLTSAVYAADIPPASNDFYVNDTANVLSEQTKNMIVENNVLLYEKTGAQIVVVTVDFINRTSIADFAYDIFNQYEIGSKENNNGLLLVLSIGDDDYYALQGKGLERTFTSGTLSYLLYEYLEPYFAQQRYDQGVASIFNAFYQEMLAVHDTAIIPPSYDYVDSDEYFDYLFYDLFYAFLNFMRVVFTFVVIVIILFAIFGTRKSSRKYTSRTHDNSWIIPTALYLGSRSRHNNPPSSSFNRSSGSSFTGSSGSSSSFTRSSGSSFSSGRSGGGSHSGGGGASRGGGAGRAGR